MRADRPHPLSLSLSKATRGSILKTQHHHPPQEGRNGTSPTRQHRRAAFDKLRLSGVEDWTWVKRRWWGGLGGVGWVHGHRNSLPRFSDQVG